MYVYVGLQLVQMVETLKSRLSLDWMVVQLQEWINELKMTFGHWSLAQSLKPRKSGNNHQIFHKVPILSEKITTTTTPCSSTCTERKWKKKLLSTIQYKSLQGAPITIDGRGIVEWHNFLPRINNHFSTGQAE